MNQTGLKFNERISNDQDINILDRFGEHTFYDSAPDTARQTEFQNEKISTRDEYIPDIFSEFSPHEISEPPTRVNVQNLCNSPGQAIETNTIADSSRNHDEHNYRDIVTGGADEQK